MVDFIAYGDWFVGNVADIAIVAAAGLMILLGARGTALDGTRHVDGDAEAGTDVDDRAESGAGAGSSTDNSTDSGTGVDGVPDAEPDGPVTDDRPAGDELADRR